MPAFCSFNLKREPHQMVLNSLVLLVVAYSLLRLVKIRHFKKLASVQQQLQERYESAFPVSGFPVGALSSFHEKIIVIKDVLPEETFQDLKEQVMGCHQTERSYLPGHKKGGTISYEMLHSLAPKIVGFYQSAYLHALCSRVIGEPVMPTPINDQSSCSLLFYDKPNDHIGWHYDYNFYHGRHFTALLTILNENDNKDRLSSANLTIRKNGEDIVIPTSPNSLVLFEGTHIYHKVTPLGDHEKRVLLSMTFCTNPKTSLLKNQIRRIKDTAYFGVRALWT